VERKEAKKGQERTRKKEKGKKRIGEKKKSDMLSHHARQDR
jgi:hypothetical protein